MTEKVRTDVTQGISSYGVYVPQFRLDRRLIGEAFQAKGGKGCRSVAGHDEDTTTLGVAAARRALAPIDGAATLTSVWFATTDPPYLEKTNATAIHDAVGAPETAAAFDVNGAVRSAVGALRAALAQPAPTLVVLSDMRTGLPGGPDESAGGDGAVALVVGSGDPLCELLGTASQTVEFLDRWREPGTDAAKSWEDRFGEQVLVPLGNQAIADALAAAGVELEQVDHLIVTGSHERAVRSVRKRLGAKARGIVDDGATTIGNVGTAQLAMMLASALDNAEPNQVIAALHLADGADAFVFRTTDELPRWRTRRDEGRAGRRDPDVPITYATFLLWRKQLHREPPRRPDPDVPAAPAAFRERTWKFGFRASQCTVCGTRHLPPQRVCASCGSVDAMTSEAVADAVGTIFTVTADHLAFSEDPPMAVGIVDFEGGGRVQCELTDLGGRVPRIGDRVEMSFRRAYTVNGIHNYVWKARLIRDGAGSEEEAHG